MLEDLALATRRTKAQAVRAAISIAYTLFVSNTSPKDLSSQKDIAIVGTTNATTCTQMVEKDNS
jgi:hypothetical protein